MTISEEWRPIPGYNGVYEVSNLGNVRSWTKASGGKLLKPRVSDKGYRYVDLRVHAWRNGSPRRKIHHLVALAFHGPRPEGTLVCHDDGNPANNQASNLKYGTASDNALDAIRHGTHGGLRANRK